MRASHCLIAAELALTCRPSFLSYFLPPRRLFDEVAGSGLVEHPAQKAEMGKLLMHGAREFARSAEQQQWHQHLVWMQSPVM